MISQLHEVLILYFFIFSMILKIRKNLITLFETENEWQKTEPVPLPLPRASRIFPDVQTRNENLKIYNWTSEIIPFICFVTGP